MVDYPSSLPLMEIKNVIDIFRSGTIQDNMQGFAHDLWVIQGYAQKTFIGDGSPNFSLMSQAAEDFDGIATLESIVAQEEGGAAAQIAVPWGLLLKWATEQLIKVLISNL